MLNKQQFIELFPTSKFSDEWVDAMLKYFPRFNINTNRRIAAFISQCGHESAGWRVFSENLNYSERGLNSVFAKYFKNANRSASDYARQPEKIANVVYANRMGNNNDGDGWKYRGRGPIQITGKENYTAFATFINDHRIVTNPDIVYNNREIGLLSAIWFWDKHNLNSFADTEDVKKITKIINGGYNGLDDRINKYEMCVLELNNAQAFNNKTKLKPSRIIKIGSTGQHVKLIQVALGIKADGMFGNVTASIVKAWQRKNGLVPDGIVGPITYNKLINE